jgi:phosphoglycolate phosphatase-like HAD superfamily hydrolase
VSWGYLGGMPVEEWGADVIINCPADILELLDRAW